MANCAGASLVRSNLQNAKLLAQNCALQPYGANLYGADGLWFGRLRRNKSFDAVLPESIPGRQFEKAIGRRHPKFRRGLFLSGCEVICAFPDGFTADNALHDQFSALNDSSRESEFP